MKKKIVALVGALVLICAMGLNVCAAGSVTAQDVVDAAGGVTVPATQDELWDSYDVAVDIIEFDESAITHIYALSPFGMLRLAPELAALNSESAVEKVEVVTAFYAEGTAGKLVVNLKSTGTETVYALHYNYESGEVERIVGTQVGDTVVFYFSDFSPVAIVKVTQAVAGGSSAPAAADTTTPAATTTVDGVVVPVAPKTGDAAMMVMVMAVIFMAGAAVAVAMSKKRA